MYKKWRLIAVSLLSVGVIFMFWGIYHSKAATSCYASVAWAKSTINQNENATEGWIVIGAAKASAHCYDTKAGGTMDSKITDTLTLNLPQSYTFPHVQHNITCEVTAVAADGTSCNTNGPQTVTVINAAATTPPPPSSASCDLFSSYANSNLEYGYTSGLNPPLGTWKLSFPANQNLGDAYSWDYGGKIEEYWKSDNVSMTVDPSTSLPSGLSLASRTITYPELPMNNGSNDELLIESYITKDVAIGFPPRTRYYISGVPTQEGKFTVILRAQSSTCAQPSTFIFEITITAPLPPIPPSKPIPDIPSAPASTNKLISFVKTIFYNDAAQNGYQSIVDMTTWGKNGDKFVLSGHYGGSFAGLPLNTQARNGGGGFWLGLGLDQALGLRPIFNSSF